MLSTRRTDLRACVEGLGGLPIVMRFSGGSTAATAATASGYAGVDLLVSEGRAEVLDANTLFYFGHFQQHGIDIALLLVGALLDDSRAPA